jgi:ATP-dependent exoDNAse (exonuclease V) alpha subunit
MDEDQKLTYDLAYKGHSILITVQAGTGKTLLVENIIKNLRSLGKHVAITASTGIAATHYGELLATTLHKWAGLNDGRYTNTELLGIIVNNKYQDVKND